MAIVEVLTGRQPDVSEQERYQKVLEAEEDFHRMLEGKADPMQVLMMSNALHQAVLDWVGGADE